MLRDVEALGPEQIFAKPLDVDRLLETLLATDDDAIHDAAAV
jgi:hypothetical protein